MRVVVDTNVLVAALRSNLGASFAFVSQLPSSKFQTVVTVPLYTEYQDVLTRPENMTGASSREAILGFLRYFAQISHRQEVFFLWRPWLKDPKDDMVLEAAVASQSHFIITFNQKDFSNINRFGIQITTPKEFLRIIEKK